MTTTTAYRVEAISTTALKELRHLDDAGEIREVIVDDEGGAPLRCCLRKSRVGERMMLVSYAPLARWAEETGASPGPYVETGPVFIHADDCGGPVSEGYPVAMHGSMRVLRAYSADGRILGGRLVDVEEGSVVGAVDEAVDALFADPEVELLHLRAVIYGCFMFEVRRP